MRKLLFLGLAAVALAGCQGPRGGFYDRGGYYDGDWQRTRQARPATGWQSQPGDAPPTYVDRRGQATNPLGGRRADGTWARPGERADPQRSPHYGFGDP